MLIVLGGCHEDVCTSISYPSELNREFIRYYSKAGSMEMHSWGMYYVKKDIITGHNSFIYLGAEDQVDHSDTTTFVYTTAKDSIIITTNMEDSSKTSIYILEACTDFKKVEDLQLSVCIYKDSYSESRYYVNEYLGVLAKHNSNFRPNYSVSFVRSNCKRYLSEQIKIW